MIKTKAGVYAIRTVLEKLLYPNKTTDKIGHTTSFVDRFNNYNVLIADVENYVQNNIDFILHSPSQCNATRILESIVHNYFKPFRMRKNKEFFQFSPKFNIEKHMNTIIEEFEKRNITDIKLYRKLEDVPYTIFPAEYESKYIDYENRGYEYRSNETFYPREYQIPIIDKAILHFNEHNMGGLYLPPGYGKTFISTFILKKLGLRNGLILTHRLSITREWIKCFSLAGFQFSIVNSENDYNENKIKNYDGFIISTYQTYRLKATIFKEEYPLVVHDEAHVLVSGEKYSECMRLGGKKLFLTATPEVRTYVESDEKENKENEDEKESEEDENEKESKENDNGEDDDNRICITETLDEKTYGKSIEYVSLHDAIDKGRLCPYRLLIHNKPSTTECFEHINDLMNIYGRKKIIVFYNRIIEAREAVEHLKSKNINTYYIDGETSERDRESIIHSFEKSDFGVIVNINVCQEGLSIPCVDSILLMCPKNSIRAFIQILGRGLRLSPNKDCCVLCIPENCQSTIETALDGLCYDSKNESRIKQNFLTEAKDKSERKKLKENLDVKLRIIELRRTGGSFIMEKAHILLEFVGEKERVPMKKEEYRDIKIGGFWHSIKQGSNGQIYIDILSRNNILRADYEKTQNIKEEKKDKKQYTQYEKADILLEFVREKGRVPKDKEEYRDIKIGVFWFSIKQGKSREIYRDILSGNDILREDYERLEKEREEKKDKKQYTPGEKADILLEFVIEKDRVPKDKEEYRDIKIGGFWSHIKQGHNQEIYIDILSKNDILRADYERLQNIKEEKKDKKQYTPAEKADILLEFVREKDRVPKADEKYKNIKIGKFWSSIKSGRNNQIYLNILSGNDILRKDYEKTQNIKDKKNRE